MNTKCWKCGLFGTKVGFNEREVDESNFHMAKPTRKGTRGGKKKREKKNHTLYGYMLDIVKI